MYNVIMKNIKILVCLILSSTLLACQEVLEESLPNGKSIETTIGFTTAAGFYAFDPDISSMEEGAERILELGSKVVKLWHTANPESTYTYNTDWSNWSIDNCVDLLKTDYYSRTLEKDFHTIILETHTFDNTLPDAVHVNWYDGMTEQEINRIEDEMYAVAYYLFTTYSGTGKSFLLQNWEGDNMLGNEHWKYDIIHDFYYLEELEREDADRETDLQIKTSIRGFVDWVNARQRGVDRARQELAEQVSDVYVWHVFEANFTRVDKWDDYYEGHPLLITPWVGTETPLVIEKVVPFTDCDLYSLSCWGATSMDRANTLQRRLEQFEAYIGESYTDVYAGNTIKQRRPMHRKGQISKLILGEYGAAERAQSGDKAWSYTDELSFETDRRHREVIQIQTDIALKHGVEYIVYWQLYCNDPRNDLSNPITRADAMNGVHATNDQLKGYWLIRPDGSFTETYKYFNGLLNNKSLYVNTVLVQEETYKIDGVSGGFEIGGVFSTDNRPSNSVEAWPYNDCLRVSVSTDGVDFSEIPIKGFYTAGTFVDKVFKGDVVFINQEPIDLNIRYFKIEQLHNQSEVALSTFRCYKPNPEPLIRE